MHIPFLIKLLRHFDDFVNEEGEISLIKNCFKFVRFLTAFEMTALLYKLSKLINYINRLCPLTHYPNVELTNLIASAASLTS